MFSLGLNANFGRGEEDTPGSDGRGKVKQKHKPGEAGKPPR